MIPSLDILELAWAAGFYSGEGYVSIRKKENRSWSLVLGVNNTYYGNLTRFQNALGGVGNINDVKQYASHHKQQWVFRVTLFEDIQKSIRSMWPMLSLEKQAQYEARAREVRLNNRFKPVYHNMRPKNFPVSFWDEFALVKQ